MLSAHSALVCFSICPPKTLWSNFAMTEDSDFLTLHNVFSAWRRVLTTNPNGIYKFCRTNYLSHQVGYRSLFGKFTV